MHKTRSRVGGPDGDTLHAQGEQRPQLCGPFRQESCATWLKQHGPRRKNPWSSGGIWSIPIKRRGHTRHCGYPGIVPPTMLTFVLLPLSKRPSVPSVRTEEVYAWLEPSSRNRIQPGMKSEVGHYPWAKKNELLT